MCFAGKPTMGDQSVLTPRGAYSQDPGSTPTDKQFGGVSNADTANASYAAQGQGSTGVRPTMFGPRMNAMSGIMGMSKFNTDPNNNAHRVANLFAKGLTGKTFF
jgi:hypothetical protein